jgi:hypothetical protein
MGQYVAPIHDSSSSSFSSPSSSSSVSFTTFCGFWLSQPSQQKLGLPPNGDNTEGKSWSSRLGLGRKAT